MRQNATIRLARAERLVLRKAAKLVGVGWTTFVRKAALMRAYEIIGATKRSRVEGIKDVFGQTRPGARRPSDRGERDDR